MDATISFDLPSPDSRTPRRHWLARHWVACLAVMMVVVILGAKNRYQLTHGVGDYDTFIYNGSYGGPQQCFERTHLTRSYSPWMNGVEYQLTSWHSLLLDLFVAAVCLTTTGFVFTRTQRRCRGWSQFSLATLLAFVALTALACVVVR